MLPDDIMDKKQVVIMSMEENKLAVAMVNPTDRYTIREISLSTGRSLNVYAIPYCDYEGFLQDYVQQKRVNNMQKKQKELLQVLRKKLLNITMKSLFGHK